MQPVWESEACEGAVVVTYTQLRYISQSADAWEQQVATELVDKCQALSAEVVVLDYTRESILPSRLLGAFLRVHRMLADRGAECRICVSTDARGIFSHTRLDRILRLYPTRAAAQGDESARPDGNVDRADA